MTQVRSWRTPSSATSSFTWSIQSWMITCAASPVMGPEMSALTSILTLAAMSLMQLPGQGAVLGGQLAAEPDRVRESLHRANVLQAVLQGLRAGQQRPLQRHQGGVQRLAAGRAAGGSHQITRNLVRP